MNSNIAVLDTFMGDNGKGAITHAFSPEFDWVVRFSGSSNSGHTIYRNGEKFVHHLIPCIDFQYPRTKGFLGANMVINLEELLNELLTLEKSFPGVSNRIYIDPDAFIIEKRHIEEDKAKNAHLGVTNKGVGPAYADKIARRGIKIRALLNDNSLITDTLQRLGVHFNYVMEKQPELSNSKIIFEGSQSVLLDPNFGTYPYVTSGECTIGGIFNAGFGFALPSIVYGVNKCYGTRVGTGPFPTEITDEKEANELRQRGGEFGATTGRPRRVGWLDLAATNYAIQKGGITNLIITKLDILNGMKEVPLCFRYDKVPVSSADLFNPKTHMMNIKGWDDPRDYAQIKELISVCEYWTGNTKVSYISCGTNKSDILGL